MKRDTRVKYLTHGYNLLDPAEEQTPDLHLWSPTLQLQGHRDHQGHEKAIAKIGENADKDVMVKTRLSQIGNLEVREN